MDHKTDNLLACAGHYFRRCELLFWQHMLIKRQRAHVPPADGYHHDEPHDWFKVRSYYAAGLRLSKELFEPLNLFQVRCSHGLAVDLPTLRHLPGKHAKGLWMLHHYVKRR